MKKIVKELAITGGIYDCICDPYDKLNNGDPYSSVMVDLERFAERIVRECLSICDKETAEYVKFRQGTSDFDEKNIYAEGEVAAMGIKYKIKHLFGVEE